MQWRRITVAEDTHIPFIQQLYETSFPAEERREFSAVKALLINTRMHLILISRITGEPAGFAIYWQFNNFLFIEHLAINPSYRGEGLGGEIMQQIFTKAGSCCILEVEHPHDENSRKRIKFYQRLGFHVNELTYFQPSYHTNGHPIPMLLLSNATLSPEQLEQFVKEVKQTVYAITEQL